ncbi:MAG TPA: class I mannose-6-phosphate isomerase [Vicinamibacteria bacterium]|nr:class I mannose-6-phosphate isomerase [Vicinamibacteria bacterium]
MPPTGRYDKRPIVPVGPPSACTVGWADILEQLRGLRSRSRCVLGVECYPGVRLDEVLHALGEGLRPALVVDVRRAYRDPAEIDWICAPFLGDDPVFGRMNGLSLSDFLDPGRTAALHGRIDATRAGLVLVVGAGATLVAEPDVLVYADLARWEIQQRQRRREVASLGVHDQKERPGKLYKRGFFVDWRVADRQKRTLLGRIDWLLDTNDPGAPKIVSGDDFRRGLAAAARRPFRLVPFFDPAPWGGQWMKEVCDLPREAANYGWCFDCVPEENSLLLGFGGARVEVPALDLVFRHPRELLGEAVHARFGDEFPIRFDFLDTMAGGNLSLQVHPLTEYIQDRFGMHYTQDESYYLLDAGEGACVYLGLRDGVDGEAMVRDLRRAREGGFSFPAELYVNRRPARKHDHFLIPGGTVHCSGKDSMVLEISSTPYLFTFKLWDWGRMGLDGRPRPVHLDHGVANIQWDREAAWVERELVNRVELVGAGEGWREERTGLHEREFIETRRHWFSSATPHDTGGGVNVLNLVEGEEAVVESPDDAFEPLVVHYAETFVVPGAVGLYTIRPHGPSEGVECATIQASVRTRP